MTGLHDPLFARLLRADDEGDVPPAPRIAPGRVPATARIARFARSAAPERTPATAVQRKQVAAAPVTDAEVARRASAGVAGFGAALPFFDEISRSFGAEHDLTGVRAHVGGDAARAAESIGAEAYATGADIAFRAAPDLHTAAHEAAHVIQQRAGAAGVGRDGDAFERHADQVADRVVRGVSAADLFSPAGGASAGAIGVQRSKIVGAGTGTSVPDDLSVHWTGDAFNLSFDATPDQNGRNVMTVAVQFVGVLPVFPGGGATFDAARKQVTLRCTVSDRTWVPSDPVITGDMVKIDLLGDPKTVLEIRQVCTLDAMPDPNRNHQIGTYVNGVLVDCAELHVSDPTATATASTPAAPAPATGTPSSSDAPWTFNPVMPKPPDVTNLTPQSVMPPPRAPKPLTLRRGDDGAIFVGPPNDPEAWMRSFFEFYELRAPIVNDLAGQRCLFNLGSTTLAEVVQTTIAQAALAGYDLGFDQVLAFAEHSMIKTAAPSPDGVRTLSFSYSFVATTHDGLNTKSSTDNPGVQLGFQANFALHNDGFGSEVAFGGQVTSFADPGSDALRIQNVVSTCQYAWAGDVVKDLLGLQLFSGIALGFARGESAIAGVYRMYPTAQATLAGAGLQYTIPGTDGVMQLGAQIATQLSLTGSPGTPATLDAGGQLGITIVLDKRPF